MELQFHTDDVRSSDCQRKRLCLRITSNEGHPECVHLTPRSLVLFKISLVFQRFCYRSSYSHVFKWSLAFRDLTTTYSFPIVPTRATFVTHQIINNIVKPITCFLSQSAIFQQLTLGVEGCYWCLFVLRHTTLGRNPLEDGSARRKDLYMTTHNAHKRQTFMPPVELDPETPASERPHTCALDHTVRLNM